MNVRLTKRFTIMKPGYSYHADNFNLGLTLYNMDYDNQLILTGKISEIGEALTSNIKDSYRAGIELVGGVRIPPSLTWNGNLTLSKNKIRHFVESIEVYDADWNFIQNQENKLGTTDIAFSPKLIANSMFNFHIGSLSADFNSQHVARQYIDNTSCRTAPLIPTSSAACEDIFSIRAFEGGRIYVTVNNLSTRGVRDKRLVYSAMVGGSRYKGTATSRKPAPNAMARLTFCILMEQALEYFGVITGLIYLFLEIKQHRAMGSSGFITSLVGVFVFFDAKVYADMALNSYYVAIGVYILEMESRKAFRKEDCH